MYQPNVPQLYDELISKSKKTMDKVLIRGSSYAVIIYIFCGTFGYLTFSDNAYSMLQDPSRSQDILEADYKRAPAV